MNSRSLNSIQSSAIRLGIIGICAALFIASSRFNQVSHSANLTSVSNTLSTSRFSFVARLTSANSAGSSIVTIDGTPNVYESTSSANIFIGDNVGIGDSSGISTYTVDSIVDATRFSLTSALGAGDADSGDFVIATRSATQTVAFTTVTAVPNGIFRILIPAITSDTNARDGIPDRGGFDFTNTTPASFPITCPSDVGATFDFTTGIASPSAVTVNGVKYHTFECRYSGTGAVGQAFTGFAIGNGTTALINPAPNASHVEGTADSYKYIVQHIDSTGTVIDSTAGAVAVIESVRVTATVDPILQFRIMGVASGTAACGTTTTVTTTSTAVPLGVLNISSFTDAAQAISISTNAVGGYAVTAIENDQLGKDGNACVGQGPSFANPCIPDFTTGNITTGTAWSATTTKGFGYSVADPNGTVTGEFNPNYKHFASAVADESESPTSLFTDTTVADNDNAYVCYRAVISASQQAGEYSNNITYRATATF